MSNIRKEIISPSHKVGIKILSEIQIRNVFPNYKDVINHIETHRKWLEEHQIQRLERYQYNLMYDNVISIFGERGTGKTSVAFTLHKQLEEDAGHPYDIVLPIIIPEVIPADSSTLGWLLAIVKDQVEEFEKDAEPILSQKRQKHTDKFWSNCKVAEMGEESGTLSDELDKLIELFYAAKYNPANEQSYNVAVGNSAKQSQHYYDFAQEIVRFWDLWVEKIKELHGEKIAPLIYFVFDDVDLAPQKVDELLSIIIKYLSHPNIMVITTADEEMFLEVIEKRLDHDIGRLPKEWRDYLLAQAAKEHDGETISSESGELVRKTARRYLGKVMPTSTRYYLKLFNTVEEKHLFHLDDGKGLWQGVCEQIDILRGHLEEEARQEDLWKENFLTENGVARDYYLNFFGNTSRQIGNTYIGLKDFIRSLCESIKNYEAMSAREQSDGQMSYVEAVYHAMWRFMYISINSNHNLAERIEEVEDFIGEIFWLQHNEWFLYINYSYLDDYLGEHLEKHPPAELVKMALQLYSLFHFAENVLLILEKCTRLGITGRRRIHGVSYLRDFLSDQVFNGRYVFRKHITSREFFAHYKVILNRMDRLMEDRAQRKKQSREYFYDLVNLTGEIPENFLTEVFRKDRDWLGEISGMLSAVFGNLYLIGKEELENSLPFEPGEPQVLYQIKIRDLLERNIYSALDSFDCLKAAEEAQKHLNAELKVRNQKEGISLEGLTQKYTEEYLKKSSSVSEAEKQDSADEIVKITDVSALLEKIERDLRQASLNDLFSLLDEKAAQDMKRRLRQGKTRTEILSILKMLYRSIAEWDDTISGAIVRNTGELYNIAYGYDMGADIQQELTGLADFIYGYIPEDFDMEASWYFSEDSNFFYREMRLYLERMQHAVRNEFQHNKKLRAVARRQIERVERKIDGAVRLEKKEEMEGLIRVAAQVQLAMRIQRLYLFWVIKEKYEQNYEYSATGLLHKKMVGEAEPEGTYYYTLFSQMAQMVNKSAGKLNQEEQSVRRFISYAASQGRNDYIRSILHEVNYESGED